MMSFGGPLAEMMGSPWTAPSFAVSRHADALCIGRSLSSQHAHAMKKCRHTSSHSGASRQARNQHHCVQALANSSLVARTLDLIDKAELGLGLLIDA